MPVSYGNMVGMVVYVRKETYEKLKQLAEAEHRSLTGTIRAILESFLELMEQQGVDSHGVQDGQEKSEAGAGSGSEGA